MDGDGHVRLGGQSAQGSDMPPSGSDTLQARWGEELQRYLDVERGRRHGHARVGRRPMTGFVSSTFFCCNYCVLCLCARVHWIDLEFCRICCVLRGRSCAHCVRRPEHTPHSPDYRCGAFHNAGRISYRLRLIFRTRDINTVSSPSISISPVSNAPQP
jgi:hypothetical protein